MQQWKADITELKLINDVITSHAIVIGIKQEF